MIRILLLGAVLSAVAAASLDLPPYVKKCKQDDPKRNECILATMKEVLPHVLNGEPQYKIPRLDPLSIEKADVSHGGFKISVMDFKIYGVKDVIFKDIQFDVDKLHIVMKINFPLATGLGKYKMDGNILVLPIKGEGDVNITVTDFDLIYTTDLERYKKSDGKDHVKPVNSEIKHKISKAFLNFSNLFNGDKKLGEATNKFLNENWKDVETEMSPAVVETIATIATNILTGVGDTVPYENLWAK